MRHKHRWIGTLLVLLFIPTMLVQGREVFSADMCRVDADERVVGDVFALCEELYIEGIVDGDIIGAALRTTISGHVTGSLYLVGGQLDITGQVGKDIHYGGAVLRYNPPIEPNNPPRNVLTARSVKAVTFSSTFFDRTQIRDGVLNVGYQLIMRGDVQGEVSFWGSALVIEGDVTGNMYAIVGDPNSESSQLETLLLPFNFDVNLLNPGLIVSETATVTGLLSYRGPEEGEIAGDLLRPANYEAPPTIVPTLDEPGTFTIYAQALGRDFGTLLVIGAVMLFLANGWLQYPLHNLRSRPFASLAVGMLSFLLSFPVVLIVLVLIASLLGFLFILGLQGVVLGVAITFGAVNIGAASVFYFVAIFISRALVSIAIGRLAMRLIFGRYDVDEHRWLQYTALLLGVTLVAPVISLPIIGIIMNALALFLGLGAIGIVVLAQIQRFRNRATPVVQQWYSPSPAIIRERRTTSEVERVPSISAGEADPDLSPTPVSLPVASASSANDTDTLDEPPKPAGMGNLPEGFSWDFFKD
ncbi:MAG: hypothetical protein AAF126_02225 [Chloroflexota bacterium]